MASSAGSVSEEGTKATAADALNSSASIGLRRRPWYEQTSCSRARHDSHSLPHRESAVWGNRRRLVPDRARSQGTTMIELLLDRDRLAPRPRRERLGRRPGPGSRCGPRFERWDEGELQHLVHLVHEVELH